jgi:hypothetical protein
MCCSEVETPEHYFLHCQNYVNYRNVMQSNLNKVTSNVCGNLENKEKIGIIVNGFKLNVIINNVKLVNIEIFKIIINYIRQTKRFVY